MGTVVGLHVGMLCSDQRLVRNFVGGRKSNCWYIWCLYVLDEEHTERQRDISEIYINTTMRIPRYNNRRMHKLLYNCQAIRHPYTPKSLFVDSSHVSPSPSPLRYQVYAHLGHDSLCWVKNPHFPQDRYRTAGSNPIPTEAEVLKSPHLSLL